MIRGGALNGDNKRRQIYHATFGAMRSGGTTVHRVSHVLSGKECAELTAEAVTFSGTRPVLIVNLYTKTDV